ncbi:site-specific integrase [Microbulbifer sp. 2201CG32-9]|uniref:tyrosine-type recombinase/integrase n=1 Tax=Microbulbifer sp. 2201CG32-9 TaxID=3232309 RepID=UPI00345C51A7
MADSDASRSEVWAAYERWQTNQQATDATVNDLIDFYFASPQYTQHLKPSTQRDYDRYSKRIRQVFGAMDPDAITSPLIQMFMDARGSKHPTAANREKTFLGIVMTWGKSRGLVNISNPCDAVKPMPESPGGRYVEDWEYEAFWKYLGTKGHVMHQCAMEIAYLCAARQQDVLALSKNHIREEGLLIIQAKTGKQQIKLWSPRLREAIDLALSTNTHAKIQTPHILRGRTGRGYTRTGFNAVWQREQRAALEGDVIKKRFRFHDLKIKSISDFEGDTQRFSGHKTRSMAEHYNRTPDQVVTLNKARIGTTVWHPDEKDKVSSDQEDS